MTKIKCAIVGCKNKKSKTNWYFCKNHANIFGVKKIKQYKFLGFTINTYYQKDLSSNVIEFYTPKYPNAKSIKLIFKPFQIYLV